MSPRNRLLAQLSEDELRSMTPYLELVPLTKGKVLYDYGDIPRYAFFPVSGMLSMLAATQGGAVLEIAMICADGFVGIPIVFQVGARSQVRVQIPGDAQRIRAEVLLKAFRKGGTLQSVVLQYADDTFAQAAQAAVCHRFHSVTERLSRWLLVAQDCVHADTIELTQEFIAHMLGIPRSAVSTAATALQDQGFIRQRHGRIQILNRRGLEQWTCECYAALRGTPQDATLDHRFQSADRPSRPSA